MMDEIQDKEVTNKIDRRTKEYRDSLQQPSLMEVVEDYTTNGAVVEPVKLMKAGLQYENCSECGEPLPGLPGGGRRKQPEACYDCVWKNYKGKI